MEALRNYILTITVCILILSVVQAAIPSGEIKKTARFIFGIIIVAILLSPFSKGLLNNLDIFADGNEYIIDKGALSQMEDLKKKQVENLFAQGVVGVVQNIINREGRGEMKVEAEVSENKISKIYIYGNANDLKDKIAKEIGISQDQIIVDNS